MNELTELKSANVALCDKAALADLNSIRVNTEGSSAERVLDFAEQVKNPYLFKVGNIAVSVIYCGDKSLTNALASVLKAG